MKILAAKFTNYCCTPLHNMISIRKSNKGISLPNKTSKIIGNRKLYRDFIRLTRTCIGFLRLKWVGTPETNVMIAVLSVVKLYDVNKVDKVIQSVHKSVEERDLSLNQLSSLCKSNPAAARSINIKCFLE